MKYLRKSFFTIGLLFLLTLVVFWFFEQPLKLSEADGQSTKAGPFQEISQNTKNPITLPTRSLIIRLPLLGDTSGAKWIPGQVFRDSAHDSEAAKTAPLEVLVDGEGRFLAARYGDDSFATTPNLEAFHEALGYLTLPSGTGYAEAPKELLGKVTSIKLIPFDLADVVSKSWIFHLIGNSTSYKYSVLFRAEVQFEAEVDARQVMIHSSTDGTIDERSLKSTKHFDDLPPEYIPYNSLRTPGANQFAATIAIQVATTPGQAGITRYTTETWSGLSPWGEEQLDPNYGKLLPDELLMPTNRTLMMRNYMPFLGNGLNPPIKPEVKARLEREATAKAAK